MQIYPPLFLDQIALPDFESGAMENWGLVTYRETALLYDPETSANGNKQRIATVVSHELAHMVRLGPVKGTLSTLSTPSLQCDLYLPVVWKPRDAEMVE